ncbi:zinc finger, RING-type [Musa troglodytarum]|uniref:Zinc finger, RING-type n=1 Tax=Musa troglodytarum TaxID=320322 RepID=A0A9E7JQV4_9LILI|nr:zinc finger, RING-type [Musa troglodytarum]
MDEQPDCLPIHSKEILTSDGVKLNKKRKLQYDLENLVLPLSKHKFGYRFRSTGHTIAEETEDVQNIDREMVAGGLKDGSEELGDSYNDSNSISEGYDTTMTLDLDDEAEKSSGKIGWPSDSSKNFDLDSFDTKKVKESGNKGNDSLEDIQQLESAYKGIDERYPGYEDSGHNIVSELGKNSLEHLDAEIEGLMLYSNDVAPHALLVSPERWSSGRDIMMWAKSLAAKRVLSINPGTRTMRCVNGSYIVGSAIDPARRSRIARQPQNLFRFKADHSADSSPFSTTATQDVPRKMPKTPAQDGVCAIQWSREGSSLAIGATLEDDWYVDACVYFLNTKI